MKKYFFLNENTEQLADLCLWSDFTNSQLEKIDYWHLQNEVIRKAIMLKAQLHLRGTKICNQEEKLKFSLNKPT